MTDARTHNLEALKARIDRADYVVDADAVADAILDRLKRTGRLQSAREARERPSGGPAVAADPERPWGAVPRSGAMLEAI